MCLERDFIRQVYALVLDLHDAGVNVTSVRIKGFGDEGTAPQRNLPPIWYHGGRGYSLDGDPIVVAEEEHNLLQAFLKKQTAMPRRELENTSGVTNAPRVLTALMGQYRGIFGPAIRRPGTKGNGGYFIRVLAGSGQT